MEPSTQGDTGVLASLARRTGQRWPQLEACASAAAELREKIAAQLEAKRLVPADCSFIVHGSLARDELTPGSDVDWTVLVDGAADPHHLSVVQGITSMLEELGVKEPGKTAVFGGLTFSHDVLNLIGGDADTNKNTTRRMLLLLESREVQRVSGVRDRVLRAILRRYLEEDQGYHAIHKFEIRVPRFLLNDIARYWRTLAVDYAAKRRERAGNGWAIRNVKLRMSRKLIFVAGLAMCLTCQLKPPGSLLTAADADGFYSALRELLLGFANQTPLEILVAFAAQFDADAIAADLVSAYEAFLVVLQDPEKRSQLAALNIDDAVGHPVYNEARDIANTFQTGLTKLFFSTNAELTSATQRYGVF